MVEIRKGRTYVARNGDKIGPMRRAKASEFNDDWPWTVDGRQAWKTNGSYSDVRPVCEFDLIAEWTEGPVRTVTRTVTETTITPGTYARITVTDEGKAGMVGIWLNSGHYFSPSDLRAAAAVLLELAGALGE